jgi:hypothetical protein
MASSRSKKTAVCACALALLALSACGVSSRNNYGAKTVTYSGVMLGNVGETYDRAHEYCSTYEQRAQMLDDDEADGTVTFACIDFN